MAPCMVICGWRAIAHASELGGGLAVALVAGLLRPDNKELFHRHDRLGYGNRGLSGRVAGRCE